MVGGGGRRRGREGERRGRGGRGNMNEDGGDYALALDPIPLSLSGCSFIVLSPPPHFLSLYTIIRIIHTVISPILKASKQTKTNSFLTLHHFLTPFHSKTPERLPYTRCLQFPSPRILSWTHFSQVFASPQSFEIIC